MDQCWMCVSCAPSRVQGRGSSESNGWAWHARQEESLCWQQFLCWVPAGVKPLAVPGNCSRVPRAGDRSLLLPWVVAAAVPARRQLLELLAGMVARPCSVLPCRPEDWWEIYKIQPVPTSPCYRRQAGGSASLFVEGQLSPWLPARTQPCTRTASPRLVSQPAWDRGSFRRRRKVLSALRIWSVSTI